MKSVAFILLIMYWGSDGRSAMTTAEFTSQATCEAALKSAANAMDGMGMSRTYSVCVEK